MLICLDLFLMNINRQFITHDKIMTLVTECLLYTFKCEVRCRCLNHVIIVIKFYLLLLWSDWRTNCFVFLYIGPCLCKMYFWYLLTELTSCKRTDHSLMINCYKIEGWWYYLPSQSRTGSIETNKARQKRSMVVWNQYNQ